MIWIVIILLIILIGLVFVFNRMLNAFLMIKDDEVIDKSTEPSNSDILNAIQSLRNDLRKQDEDRGSWLD